MKQQKAKKAETKTVKKAVKKTSAAPKSAVRQSAVNPVKKSTSVKIPDPVKTLEKMREFYNSQATRPLSFRKKVLKRLYKAVAAHENDIANALQADLGKVAFESYASETGMVLHEIRTAIRNLSGWARKKRVSSPFHQFPASSYIMYEPYGVVLILAPWNYPFQLLMMPLVGAIAAGNCVMVKTGNAASNTGAVINRILSECFESNYVAVYEGGRDVIARLLELRYDYIFFTGGKILGSMVLSKAARYLTPVTLEMGGKSPVVLDKGTNLELAAKRIAWGKLLNCGQTCVAPDYVLAEQSIHKQFIEEYKKAVQSLFGNDIKTNPEYPRLVSDSHFQKVVSFLKDGKIVYGGASDRGDRFVEPTVMLSPSLKSPIMQQEIFGPILPVIPYKQLDDALRIINEREKPLQLYIFSKSKAIIDRVLRQTSAGGVCVNDVVVQITNASTPFGGVGESGMGGYHGRFSFETFSHRKPVMRRSVLLDLPMRYAPYKEHNLKMIKMLLR